MSYYRNLILGGGYYWDADAVAFLNAASITDIPTRRAVNIFTIGLKDKNLWTKIVSLHPFVGANATAHRYNLKNPVAFLGTFAGGVTHDVNGITTNGSTGYFDTKVQPSVNLTLNDETLFFYSRTDTGINGADMGSAVSTTQRDLLYARQATDTALVGLNSSTNGLLTVTGVTSGLGLFTGTRVSSTDLQFYRNSTSLGTKTTSNNGTRSNLFIYVGGRNQSGILDSPVARNYAMAGTATGLSSTEVSDFYTLTQAFQTSLGRQV
jgi:hypothetical protein